MDRMACVDLPALPLQILLRRHPEWADEPVAVVDRDKSLGTVQWVNKHARARRIRAGMRYTTGLSLARDLRGGVVAGEQVQQTVASVMRRLWKFSPAVEPSSREPGVFWLQADGLQRLYASHEVWISDIGAGLRQAGFQSWIAVGVSRFGTYAAAKATSRHIVFSSAEEEKAYVRRVPIGRLRLDPSVCDTLLKLGVDTLGGFIDLPERSIRRRFNDETCELYRLATGNGWDPLNPEPVLEPVRRTITLEDPETDLTRLLLVVEPLLQSMLQEVAARREVLVSFRFALHLDDKGISSGRLSPAAPTLDLAQLMPLIRLRLEALSLSSGVVELRFCGAGIRATRRQLELFRQTQERDLAAVHRAVAEIRANMGHEAVVCARLHERHLPEARYSWEPLSNLDAPSPDSIARRPLVRRIYSPPLELRSRQRHEPDGWIVGRLADGPVEEVIGPHMVCGGWWSREVSRAYYYVRTRSGRWFWIYNDQIGRRWFLQGEVE